MITSFDSKKQFRDYITDVVKKSLLKKKIHIGNRDRILTLSTCSYEFKDERMVIHTKLVE